MTLLSTWLEAQKLHGRAMKRRNRQMVVIALVLFVTGVYLFTSPEALEVTTGWGNQLNQITRMIDERFNPYNNRSEISLPLGERKRRFPQCIIFGVSKCGTRAMLDFLTLHPDVVSPNHEINYFDHPEVQDESGLGWYLQQMPPSYPHQITLEKSPDYFQTEEAPKLIYNLNKDVKLILLLRDPVKRLISEYMQIRDKHPGRLPPFEDWVMEENSGQLDLTKRSVRIGMYSEHLTNWFSVFPKNQIIIVETKRFTENPYTEIKQVETFLNLKPYFIESDFHFNKTKGFYCVRFRAPEKLHCLGETKGRPLIEVDHGVLKILYAFYEPYNQHLFKMINKTFEWKMDT